MIHFNHKYNFFLISFPFKTYQIDLSREDDNLCQIIVRQKLTLPTDEKSWEKSRLLGREFHANSQDIINWNLAINEGIILVIRRL